MIANLGPEGALESMMEEDWCPRSPAWDREDLVNSVIDSLVQANVDLNAVTLDEMKSLLAAACRRRLTDADGGRLRPRAERASR